MSITYFEHAQNVPPDRTDFTENNRSQRTDIPKEKADKKSKGTETNGLPDFVSWGRPLALYSKVWLSYNVCNAQHGPEATTIAGL
jgi:hypothetical protein